MCGVAASTRNVHAFGLQGLILGREVDLEKLEARSAGDLRSIQAG